MDDLWQCEIQANWIISSNLTIYQIFSNHTNGWHTIPKQQLHRTPLKHLLKIYVNSQWTAKINDTCIFILMITIATIFTFNAICKSQSQIHQCIAQRTLSRTNKIFQRNMAFHSAHVHSLCSLELLLNLARGNGCLWFL